MKTYKFWNIGNNKNMIEELFIWIFHRHKWTFWKNDEWKKDKVKWYRCKGCGLIKVEEE